MSPQQIIAVAVRLFAIYLAFKGIGYLGAIPALVDKGYEASQGSYQMGVLGGLHLLVAGCLWVFPMVVAHKILPRTGFSDQLSVQASFAARVGCALIGLWFFTLAFNDIVWFVFSAVGTSYFSSLDVGTTVDLLRVIVEIFFSVLLMLRSDLFARLVVPSEDAAKS